jgi:hypothetical protein
MNQVMDVTHQSKVTVGQFYGIELEEFPARIARTALYLMDHQENLKLSRELGRYFARFPIPTSPHIAIGNALQMDWNDVLPVEEATVVCGNPPFVGSRMASPEQKVDQEQVWKGNKRQGTLDYVTNWFKIAAEYVAGTPVRVAFVSTNSITQGEQPATLWRELWRHRMEIDFAHRTFAWTSEAKGKAAVHVVIVGFSCLPKPSKRPLWVYQKVNGASERMDVSQINPYLIDAPNVVIGSRQGPLVGGMPPMLFGSMPRDNGHLSNISPEDALQIQTEDPLAAKYLRKLIGADELLNGSIRYCLWLVDADPTDIARSYVLQQRLMAVREMRLASKAESTRRAATTPGLFVQLAQPEGRYLAVPRVSSESREYLPTAFFENDVIASDALLTIPGADETLFGIISSKAFTAWNRTISGRLKSDMRVSQEITYNNFPWLECDDPERVVIGKAARDLLKIRSDFPTATLSDLYNPIGMPPPLVEAHKRLDRVVLKAYGIKPTATAPEILSKLLTRYEALSAPLLAGGS